MKIIQVDNYILTDEYADWGYVTPKTFRQQLQGNDDDVLIEINSGGGFAFVAFALVNMLQEYQRQGRGAITTRITGMAASAAAVLFIAGQQREVYHLSYFMQHMASGVVFGNQNDLRSSADLLAQIDQITAADLAVLTKCNPKKMLVSLRDEYNLVGGQKIVAAGIATALLDGDGQQPATGAESADLADKPMQAVQLAEFRQYFHPIHALDSALVTDGLAEKSNFISQFFGRKPIQTKENKAVTDEEHKAAVKQVRQAEQQRVQKIYQLAAKQTKLDEGSQAKLQQLIQTAVSEGVSSAKFAEQVLEADLQAPATPLLVPPKNDLGVQQSIPSGANEPRLEDAAQAIQQQIEKAEKASALI